jgi:hypothetical protein
MNEECLEHARSSCLRMQSRAESAVVPHSFIQSEREKEKERERERESEKEGGREREMLKMVALFLF